MRVLVTNDDGIAAPGLAALVRALADIGLNPRAVAPEADQSGIGTAVGRLHTRGPIQLRSGEVAGIPATILPGTPALVVLLDQQGIFGEPADVVFAGINAGANCGRSLIHSGTVGAALAAAASGSVGIALSLAPPERDGAEYQWGTARAIAVAASSLATQRVEYGFAVNVNVPDLPLAEVRGWRRTTVADGGMSQLHARRTETGKAVEFCYGLWSAPFPPDTDSGAVHDGYVSVTWLGSVYDGAEVPPVASLSAFEDALDQLLSRPGVTG